MHWHWFTTINRLKVRQSPCSIMLLAARAVLLIMADLRDAHPVMHSHRTSTTKQIQGNKLAYLCLGQGLDVLLRLLTVDEREVAVRGGPQGLDDQLELVNVVLARKQRLPLQQFC